MSALYRNASCAWLAALAVSALASTAAACPSCPTAAVVRARVFDDRFWVHLGAISLPIVVLSILCALLYRIGARPRRRERPMRTRELGA